MQRDAKYLFRASMILILFLIIGGYTYYQSQKLLEGPEIIIETPKNGETLNDSFVEIKGVARNIKTISMNDRPIFIDEEGHLDEKLLLYPGTNIIRFKAEDKFGKEKQLDLVLFYKNFI